MRVEDADITFGAEELAKQAVGHDNLHALNFENERKAITLAQQVVAKSDTQRDIIDFDDMLHMAVKFNARFEPRDWIFVDEAQDLNSVQHEIVARMIKHKLVKQDHSPFDIGIECFKTDTSRLVAVGDPHQAIYGFRGALSDSMDTLKRRFFDANVSSFRFVSVSQGSRERGTETLMHYSNLVIIEKTDDVEKAVEQTMESGREQWWDWYQIGGRWTGLLDGYEPENDPKNKRPCTICAGTGKRQKPPKLGAGDEPCNGCGSTGTETLWPTEWSRHEGDILPIEKLTQEKLDKFYRVVLPWGDQFPKQRFEYKPWKDESGKFIDEERPPLGWLQSTYQGHLCVVVDNHN